MISANAKLTKIQTYKNWVGKAIGLERQLGWKDKGKRLLNKCKLFAITTFMYDIWGNLWSIMLILRVIIDEIIANIFVKKGKNQPYQPIIFPKPLESIVCILIQQLLYKHHKLYIKMTIADNLHSFNLHNLFTTII